MSNKIQIPENIQSEIADTINIELLKRGFPSISIKHNENDRYPALTIISEEFNTTPVIMKSIQVDNFGGSIREENIKLIRDNEIIEEEVISIWIPVHVSYTHFDGGSNGTSLFSYTCSLWTDELNRIRISKEQIH